MGYSFRLTAFFFFYMHHPTDRITHTTNFVVEHWLERQIAQLVHHEGSIRRPLAPRANGVISRSFQQNKTKSVLNDPKHTTNQTGFPPRLPKEQTNKENKKKHTHTNNNNNVDTKYIFKIFTISIYKMLGGGGGGGGGVCFILLFFVRWSFVCMAINLFSSV